MKAKTLSVLLAIGLVAAACGDGTADDTTTTSAAAAATTTTAAEEVTTTTAGEATTTSAAAEMDEGVHVADSDFGEILVNPEGFTLYIFTNDTDGESTCYDACADLWPPVDASTPIASDLDQAMFGTTTRTDGSEQLTVNGMPLYLYTPDANPGDVTGQGFNDVWFVVDPQGNMIEAAAGDIVLDYGY